MKAPSIPQTQSLPESTIPTYGVGDDLVILLGKTALVSSKSKPGTWREVDVVRHLCECPAFIGIPGKFEGRGHCRHVDAVKTAEEMDRASAQPIPNRCVSCGTEVNAGVLRCVSCGLDATFGRRCSVCGGPSTVTIAGVRYCGKDAPLPGSAEHDALMAAEERAMRWLDARDDRNLRIALSRVGS